MEKSKVKVNIPGKIKIALKEIGKIIIDMEEVWWNITTEIVTMVNENSTNEMEKELWKWVQILTKDLLKMEHFMEKAKWNIKMGKEDIIMVHGN